MTEIKRIAFHTLGCKLNFSETSTISRQFGLDGFQIVDFDQAADYYVVHTCSVTAVAEKKCKAAIRQAHRHNAGAGIAVIGCAAQANPQVFEKMEGVKWVLGNQDKFELSKLISDELAADDHHYGHHVSMVSDISKTRSFIPSYSLGDRTRSFFKIQDGCDYFCTYCSIPFMRGRSRSETIENTMAVAREIAATEIREIILTGVNIGDFGRQNGQTFYGLLQGLNQLDGIDRIRISSVEPELLSDEIIVFVSQSEKLLPHFHIPLQNGSDRILQLMKRKYVREIFENRVQRIKELMPQACIAADVIVGFPGETDDDFNDMYEFINRLDISYLHVFSYSERPGTKALQLDDKVPEPVKKQRSRQLHELSEAKKHDFYSANIGKTLTVLWESDTVDGWMHGWTENYIHVRTNFSPELINKLTKVTLESITREKELICAVRIMSEPF